VVFVSLTAACLIVVVGTVFALLTYWPLFLLALIAGLAGFKARTVRQRHPRTRGGGEMTRSSKLRRDSGGAAARSEAPRMVKGVEAGPS
jgi:hypothetical protein